MKPNRILETGVFYGGNTTFILAALHKNLNEKLISIDLPHSKILKIEEKTKKDKLIMRHELVGDSEYYKEELQPGFMIPDYLRDRWNFIEGNSLEIIPTLTESFEFYLHDSDHSFHFLNNELNLAYQKLSKDALIVVDDLTWSNSFFKFCVEKKLYPLLQTDNGKDDLMVRTGIVKLDHPQNGNPHITG